MRRAILRKEQSSLGKLTCSVAFCVAVRPRAVAEVCTDIGDPGVRSGTDTEGSLSGVDAGYFANLQADTRSVAALIGRQVVRSITRLRIVARTLADELTHVRQSIPPKTYAAAETLSTFQTKRYLLQSHRRKTRCHWDEAC